MMNSSAAAEGAHPGLVPDIIRDDTPTHWPAALWNGLSRPGISVLDKLIKTCPVWLQLCMEKDQASQVLGSEPAGIFLVRRGADLKTLILSIHVSSENTADEVSEYSIKEEKSMLYLEGSVLVFEDIFKLVAFYCVSRDVLPFTLRLPHAILEAKTYTELDTISNLGMGFWDSTLNIKGGGSIVHQKGTDLRNIQFSSAKSSQHSSRGTNQGSCEIELSVGNDRLWFVNPIFIEECSNSLFHEKPPMESHSVESHVSIVQSSYRRPPPPPPPSLLSHAVKESGDCSQGRVTSSVGVKPYKEMRMDRKEVEGKDQCASDQSPKKPFYPAIPPRRRSSEKHAGESLVAVCRVETCETQEEGNTMDLHSSHEGTNSALAQNVPADMMVTHLVHIQGEEEVVSPTESEGVPEDWATAKAMPVPPPRKKRLSHQAMHTSLVPLKPTMEEAIDGDSAELQNLSLGDSEAECRSSSVATNGDPTGDGRSSPDSKKSDTSLNSPAQYTSISEQDSLSTSSTEDDLEQVVSRPIKKSHSIMLDKAKHRLSLATLSSVFTAFLSADRKVQKRITELAQDKDSYFGRLVQDFKAYSVEMMGKHSSSTEMLQEIRMMMTQLKSYLLQSTELQTIIDPTVHKEEKLEVIIEAALCKCVLKPLREAIESHLCIIHTSDGALRLLKENQLVIQATTTTDLGVTTPVPEAVVMDKILSKFSNMHKAYSPEKKIAFLLKSCKLIYNSMSLGNPGKPYGADDFLPVLMYVLARSNLTELLLDVEYMMELMDPALQLGEGSYYLTTTYGALEHIKNYDKVTVTRQLSVEVQDSIHRWEKRRTLSKARVSRSSVQDFITISFQEPDAQTRTLTTRPDTSAALLAHQCAEKFEVADPQAYSLFVLVDGRCLRLASDSQPHQIKSYLLKSETKRDFNFLYKEIGSDEAAAIPVIKVTDFLE